MTAALTPEQREAHMDEYQRRVTDRRIADILRAYPIDDLTLKEAQATLATLGGIVRVRQGSISGWRVAITLNEPAGHVAIHDLAAKPLAPQPITNQQERIHS